LTIECALLGRLPGNIQKPQLNFEIQWKVYGHVIHANTCCNEMPPWPGHLFIWMLSSSTQIWWINQLLFGIPGEQREGKKSVIQLLLITCQARSPSQRQWQVDHLQQQALKSVFLMVLQDRPGIQLYVCLCCLFDRPRYFVEMLINLYHQLCSVLSFKAKVFEISVQKRVVSVNVIVLLNILCNKI
jgi:hypothetical protein